MTTMIEYFNSLSDSKQYMFDSEYASFPVGRYFSRFIDASLHVNRINLPSIDPKMHHDYLFYSLRPKKRFSKLKKQASRWEDINAISMVMKVSVKVAKEYLQLLTEEQMEEITRCKEMMYG